MRTLGSFLTFLVIIALFLGVIWGVIQGGKYVIAQFNLLESQTAALAIIFSVVILLSAFIIAGAIRNYSSRNDKHVHPEKSFIYNNFIDYYIEIRNLSKTQGKINLRFRSDLSLWASGSVLKSYLLFNQYLNEPESDNSRILHQARRVIMEMRKDLGQSNQSLKMADLDQIIFTPNAMTQKKDNQPHKA